MWAFILGTAAGTATANPVLIVFSVYGLARVIHDLTKAKEPIANITSVAKDVMNAVAQKDTTETFKEEKVVFDFFEMRRLYEEAGESGVYAYLCENDLVKDWRHGQYIINHVFLPEYQRMKTAESRAANALEEDTPTEDA